MDADHNISVAPGGCVWESTGLICVNCFGEICDTAEYGIVFAALFLHWFFFSEFYLDVVSVIVVIGGNVVEFRGAYSLLLAFDVALDRFIRIGKILMD